MSRTWFVTILVFLAALVQLTIDGELYARETYGVTILVFLAALVQHIDDVPILCIAILSYNPCFSGSSSATHQIRRCN